MDSTVMMVPRVGAQSYWMSRYLERGESLARMLSATRLLSLDNKFHFSADKHPLLYFLVEDHRSLEACRDGHQGIDNEKIESFLVYHQDNPTSLVASFNSMRENAKLVREILGDAMWQTINDLHLWLGHPESRQVFQEDRCNFYKKILDYCLLLKGIFYDSMLRDHYFHIIEIGIMIERANQMINVIDKLTRGWIERSNELMDDREEKINFCNLLIECGALRDGYFRKVHNFEPESLVKFFLYEKFSPYSIQYCLENISSNLAGIFDEDTHFAENNVLTIVQQLAESLSEKNLASLSARDIGDKAHTIYLKLNEINRFLRGTLEAV